MKCIICQTEFERHDAGNKYFSWGIFILVTLYIICCILAGVNNILYYISAALIFVQGVAIFITDRR